MRKSQAKMKTAVAAPNNDTTAGENGDDDDDDDDDDVGSVLIYREVQRRKAE